MQMKAAPAAAGLQIFSLGQRPAGQQAPSLSFLSVLTAGQGAQRGQGVQALPSFVLPARNDSEAPVLAAPSAPQARPGAWKDREEGLHFAVPDEGQASSGPAVLPDQGVPADAAAVVLQDPGAAMVVHARRGVAGDEGRDRAEAAVPGNSGAEAFPQPAIVPLTRGDLPADALPEEGAAASAVFSSEGESVSQAGFRPGGLRPTVDAPLQDGVARPVAAPSGGLAAPAAGQSQAVSVAPSAARGSEAAEDLPDLAAALFRAEEPTVRTAAPQPALQPDRAAPSRPAAAVQVADGVLKASSSPGGRFAFVLSPADLGRVEVILTRGDGHHAAAVIVDRPETLDAIRAEARTLERILAEAGMDVRSGSVSFALREGRDEAAPRPWEGHARPSRDGEAPPLAPARSAAVPKLLGEGRGIRLNIKV